MCFVVKYRRAHDHYVFEMVFIRTLEEIEDKTIFSYPVCLAIIDEWASFGKRRDGGRLCSPSTAPIIHIVLHNSGLVDGRFVTTSLILTYYVH